MRPLGAMPPKPLKSGMGRKRTSGKGGKRSPGLAFRPQRRVSTAIQLVSQLDPPSAE
jgi:hypothetical protein